MAARFPGDEEEEFPVSPPYQFSAPGSPNSLFGSPSPLPGSPYIGYPCTPPGSPYPGSPNSALNAPHYSPGTPCTPRAPRSPLSLNKFIPAAETTPLFDPNRTYVQPDPAELANQMYWMSVDKDVPWQSTGGLLVADPVEPDVPNLPQHQGNRPVLYDHVPPVYTPQQPLGQWAERQPGVPPRVPRPEEVQATRQRTVPAPLNLEDAARYGTYHGAPIPSPFPLPPDVFTYADAKGQTAQLSTPAELQQMLAPPNLTPGPKCCPNYEPPGYHPYERLRTLATQGHR